MVKLAKNFLQLSLKFANLKMGIMGIPMLTYGLWMIRIWQHGAETSPSTPDYVHFPWFIHAYLGVGTVSCAIACFGHVATNSPNSRCLSFYMFVIFVLLLSEIGMSTDAFLNSDWEKDLPEDPSGRFDDFKEFVKSNSDACQCIGWLSLIAQVRKNPLEKFRYVTWFFNRIFDKQVFSIVLAIFVMDIGEITEHSHENEREYAEPRVLLLRHPELPSNSPFHFVTAEPFGRPPHFANRIV